MFVLVFGVGLQPMCCLAKVKVTYTVVAWNRWGGFTFQNYTLSCFCDAEQSLYTSCVLNIAMCLLGLGAPAVAFCLLVLLSVACVGQCLWTACLYIATAFGFLYFSSLFAKSNE